MFVVPRAWPLGREGRPDPYATRPADHPGQYHGAEKPGLYSNDELNGNAGAGVDQQPRAEWGLRITRSVPNIEELRSHVSREREEIADADLASIPA